MSSSTRESEKALRIEIAERNSKVENEEQYAIMDGAGVATVPTEEEESNDVEKPEETAVATKSTATTDEAMELEAKLERVIKQRPYPLFMMEKAAEIVEDTIEGLLGKGEGSIINSNKREKVVVLGTGWGAAAFLKGIDTTLYDVTVISPRNYFVFTPMLAGASVGTVEYRSITEPVREVRPTLFVIHNAHISKKRPSNLHFVVSWICSLSLSLSL
jgi:hypothetical protein